MDSKGVVVEQRQLFGNRPAHWLREILAIFVSLVSLTGLAFLLAAFDGKPIFDFHGLTLNTLVSVLSTLSKAALILVVSESTSQWKWILYARGERQLIDFERIDRASRGLRGSWVVMWMRNSSLALRLGALVMFLAIFVDPFAQQLIQFRSDLVWTTRPALDSNQTAVPLAQRYSLGTEVRQQVTEIDKTAVEGHRDVVSVDADFALQSAVLFGLSQPLFRIQQQLPVACASSNCTWPAFESLAVCSTCNRLDSELKRFERMGGGLYLPTRDNAGGAVAGPVTGYALPNGLVIDNLNGRNSIIFGEVLMTTLGTVNPSETISLKHLDTMIYSLAIIKAGRADPNNATGPMWPDLPVTAAECALYYCVNSYESKVLNGVLNETTVRVDKVNRDQDSWQSQPDRSYNLSTFTQDQLDSLAFDRTISFVRHTDLRLTTPGGGAFNISQAAVDSISGYFQGTFANGLNQSNWIEYQYPGAESPGRISGYYAAQGKDNYIKPITMQALYAAEDLNLLFTGLATSMSNAIRAGADAASRAAGGRVGVITTSYRIEWPWIALQGVVAMAGVVILVATVWASGDSHVPVWKSSALAVLSRGPWASGVLEGTAEVREMQRDAKGREVRLL